MQGLQLDTRRRPGDIDGIMGVPSEAAGIRSGSRPCPIVEVAMPREYVKIRDRLIKEGRPAAKAKSLAAAIYNKRHPSRPVTASCPKKKG